MEDWNKNLIGAGKEIEIFNITRELDRYNLFDRKEKRRTKKKIEGAKASTIL